MQGVSSAQFAAKLQTVAARLHPFVANARTRASPRKMSTEHSRETSCRANDRHAHPFNYHVPVHLHRVFIKRESRSEIAAFVLHSPSLSVWIVCSGTEMTTRRPQSLPTVLFKCDGVDNSEQHERDRSQVRTCL